MREDEVIGADFAIAGVEEIEIDDARGIAAGAGGAAKGQLEGAQVAEEGGGIAGELGFHDGIEEGIGAGRALDGAGEIDARYEDGRGKEGAGEDAGAGLAQEQEAIPEVRAKSDAGSHRRPRTSCMS
jgi:hypothetical protein